ncbi:MAG TPA: 30S ribosomal protein S20 [Bacillota bacterium]|nr:30S ribosomal protein S20 [Bacillota bacterium]HPZ91852.1 30S ribosomal protein S20 [Bacillota bacterium]HQE03111.1 30S ribosomal protein S20 [Bacillota bacterium]
MPINRSAIKRAKTSKKRQMRNVAVKSQVRTAIKKYELSLAEGDSTRAAGLLEEAISTIDKAAQKGVIHRNEADRRKSRLARKLNALTAQAESGEEGTA